jgi:hypothetical protein
VCALRALSRQREMLLRSQARHVQHMQEALTQMNIQLANVISDVVGETGQKILRAIVAGERDGQVLAAMKNVRIHASSEEIAKSLHGKWRAEHLFALKQALALFDFYATQLAECDGEIDQQLQRLQVHQISFLRAQLPRRKERADGMRNSNRASQLAGDCVYRTACSHRCRCNPEPGGDAMRMLNVIACAVVQASRFFAALFLLFPLPALAVDGFNLPGSDYANFNAGSPTVCRNTCGGDSRCQAWTWVKPGIQGPSGHCWLKHRLPTLVRDACCNSGSRENISKRDLKAEDRIDRPGLDYRNYPDDSWKTCESACAQDQRCAAWTYARAGLQGPRGHCWLKDGVPHPVDNPKTVSGVKFKPASVAIDPGTNLVPAPG